MPLHQIVDKHAGLRPSDPALIQSTTQLSYLQLQNRITVIAGVIEQLGLVAGDRVAIVANKTIDNVCTLFATSAAGGIFVPVNPVLKTDQVTHILNDCAAKILVLSAKQLKSLLPELANCPSLESVVLIDSDDSLDTTPADFTIYRLKDLTRENPTPSKQTQDENDLAAIIYTSGSTGKPKGVMLSHQNIITGARSVATYLKNDKNDRLLLILPISFDYGLNQLTSAFFAGSSVVLHNYFLPKDVISAVSNQNITGLAAVPHIWNKLANLDWPNDAQINLRYITNTGGSMPVTVTKKLLEKLPSTDIYLMYGLTEAFRSTYLPPEQVNHRPTSIGKAIPNADVVVVRPDGTKCEPEEIGQLVHSGPLVASGYWGNESLSAQRFKVPTGDIPLSSSRCVWSGDYAYTDEEGYIYYIGRKDDSIKTHGYRVSPNEIEEILYKFDGITEAVAVGVPHDTIGHAIVVFLSADTEVTEADLIAHCKINTPSYMHPQSLVFIEEFPRNQNDKIDRGALLKRYVEQQ